jgi:hypothetical protein
MRRWDDARATESTQRKIAAQQRQSRAAPACRRTCRAPYFDSTAGGRGQHKRGDAPPAFP